MHWYCLFIDDKPVAGWHRHRRDAMRDAVNAGAALSDGAHLVWQPTAYIHVCDSAHDRDQWVKLMNMPAIPT